MVSGKRRRERWEEEGRIGRGGEEKGREGRTAEEGRNKGREGKGGAEGGEGMELG